MRRPSGQSGLTLLEVLLSVTIIGLLTGLSWPVYASFLARNDLDLATQSTAHALRRAQTYARGMYYDSAWSVLIDASGATVFRGATYASRDTTYDEKTSYPDGFSISSGTTITFAKLSGTPSSSASITLTSSTNETRTVTLNAAGMVE